MDLKEKSANIVWVIRNSDRAAVKIKINI